MDDGARPRPRRAIRVTWWGHASVLIEDGARVLTDPLLTMRVLHLRRRAGDKPPDEARRCDVAVISHLHPDHLHLPSLRLLDRGTTVLVPRGGGRLLRGLDLHVIEMAPGEDVTIRETRISAVPAAHSDRRWPWGFVRARALGYLVTGSATTYFAGDTAPFPEMATLHATLDLALVPVGGWGPWLRGQHLDPAEAACCLQMLRPQVAVPIHYGTLWPRGMGWVRPRAFFEPGRRFAARARAGSPDVEVRLLGQGTSTEMLVR